MNSFLLFFALFISTVMYLYLHKKTRMNIKFIFIDNLIVAFIAFGLTQLLFHLTYGNLQSFLSMLLSVIVLGVLIFGLGCALTMIRFWRTPNRKLEAKETEIVSPADGNIIYIKKIEANEIPFSIKNKVLSSLSELTKTDLLKTPCWLIGINMTPFDVHKNCAPVSGKIVLNQHFNGKFLSLKLFESEFENERNTIVIKNDHISVGVVQIASKRVRRIDSYVNKGDLVKKGDWLGMIRFGSQVDLIIPENCKVKVSLGQQIYAIKTIMAEL